MKIPWIILNSLKKRHFLKQKIAWTHSFSEKNAKNFKRSTKALCQTSQGKSFSLIIWFYRTEEKSWMGLFSVGHSVIYRASTSDLKFGLCRRGLLFVELLIRIFLSFHQTTVENVNIDLASCKVAWYKLLIDIKL